MDLAQVGKFRYALVSLLVAMGLLVLSGYEGAVDFGLLQFLFWSALAIAVVTGVAWVLTDRAAPAQRPESVESWLRTLDAGAGEVEHHWRTVLVWGSVALAIVWVSTIVTALLLWPEVGTGGLGPNGEYWLPDDEQTQRNRFLVQAMVGLAVAGTIVWTGAAADLTRRRRRLARHMARAPRPLE